MSRLLISLAAAAVLPGLSAQAEVIGYDTRHQAETEPSTPPPAWLDQSREIAKLVYDNNFIMTTQTEAREEQRAFSAEGDERLEKLNRLIASYLSLGYAEKAEKILPIYEMLAEKAGSRRHLAALGVMRAYQKSLEGDYKLAAEEITKLLAAEEDPYVVATGSALAAYAWTDSGYPSRAFEIVRRGRLAAKKLEGSDVVLSGVHDAWAYASLDTGDIQSAVEQSKLSLEYALSAQAAVDGISILFNLTIIASDEGQHAAAHEFAAMEAALAQKTNIPEEIFYASILCAKIEEAAADFAVAEQCARDAVTNPAAVEDYIVTGKSRLANALARLGRAKEARAIYEDLKATVNPETAPRDAINLKKLEARVLFAEGSFEPAMTAFEEYQIESDRLQKSNFNDGVRELRASLENDLEAERLRALATAKEAALMKARVRSQQALIALGFVLFFGAVVILVVHRQIAARLAVAKKAAESANRAKTDFLASMSHELRTPLNGVLGMAQSLAGEPLDPAQHGKVEAILDSGKSLLALLNDVLDLSKVEAGKMEISPVDDDLELALRRVVNLFEPLAAEKGNALTLTFADSAPKWLNFDPVRVRQCVTNLVSNAVKFTKNGAIGVKVSAQDVDGRLLMSVSVSDTGIGMSMETQSRLFAPYLQGDASITREFGGTGLGLVIAGRMARLMEGDISVESETGAGTTMTLTFSAQAATSAAPRQTDGPAGDIRESLPALRHASSVLVVDDVLVNRQVAKLFIKPLEAKVFEAASGFEALEILAREEIDLVLLDIQMPGIDGYETARRIRRLHSSNANAAIVGLTASNMDGDSDRCLAAGMDGYATKPLDSRGMMSVIAAALAKRRACRADDAA